MPLSKKQIGLSRLAFIIFILVPFLFVSPIIASDNMREVLYAVSVNGASASDGMVFLSSECGVRNAESNPPESPLEKGGKVGFCELYASAEDLRSLRLRPPSTGGIDYKGQIYYPLSGIQGLKSVIDGPDQTINLEAPPSLFEASIIDSRRVVRLKPETGRGLFLNYDLSLSGGDYLEDRLDGLFEAGFFSRYGVFLGTMSDQDIGEENREIRLETTYQYDDVEKKASYRLGDATSRGGTMGRSVRFGGFQWATNFGTQPGFITYPSISTIGGTAELPSALDVYINNVKRLSSDLPVGPFELYNIPMVSGSGDIMIVVKDLLGREHIINIPYYLSPLLLKKGLSDFSFEAGWERLNYGTKSNDYDRALAVGTHRYGITNTLTQEAHIESLSEQQTAGLSFVKLFPSVGVFTAGAAGSRSGEESGEQWLIGYEYISTFFNIGANYRAGSRDFLQIGTTEEQPQRYQAQARIGVSLGTFGQGGLSYTEQSLYDQEETKAATANYRVKVGTGQLSMTGFKEIGKDAYGASVMYIMYIDRRRSVVASGNVESNQKRDGIEVQQTLPSSGTGYAWGIRAEKGDNDFENLQGRVMHYGQSSATTLEASRLNDTDAYRAGINGGLVFLKEGVFISRRINQSFALAEVGVPDVTVYSRNIEVGKTDRSGYLLVPDLLPYENNILQLSPDELPMDAELTGEAEANTAPYYRSGVKVPFKVRVSRSVGISVKAPDGKWLPAGTVIYSADGSRKWVTAKKGMVYVTDVETGELGLVANIDGKIYGLVINVPKETGDVPMLGTFTFDRSFIIKDSGIKEINLLKGEVKDGGVGAAPLELSPEATSWKAGFAKAASDDANVSPEFSNGRLQE